MNKIVIGILAVIIILGIGVVATSGGDDSSTQSSENTTTSSEDMSTEGNETVAENTVILDDLAFMTEELTVKKGTTVTWENRDTARHDINFTDAAMDSADSELFGQGETYEYTFDEVGTFDYSCTPHPFMKATVVVTE